MVSVQSFIRAEVSRGASLAPEGVEAFAAYAIASAKGLIPEMDRVFPARLGLEAPALARLVGAPAFKNPEPSQGQHSRLGPGLARPQAPALKKPG